MRLLWIATKSPWPPRDGGRLVQALTLEALRAAGLDITVVAPGDLRSRSPGERNDKVPSRVRVDEVSCRPSGRLVTGVRTAVRNLPWTAATHHRREVRTRVGELLGGGDYDVAHVEQIQAWPQAAPARESGVPIVLRAQNVESDLWRGVADLEWLPKLLRLAARWESARLTRWEGEVVRRAHGVVALTARDAERLSTLAGGRAVSHLPAPFPASLPTSLPGAARELAGDPPLVLFGSGGWLPNRDARRWFLEELWPRVVRAQPDARLHLFGAEVEGREGVRCHPAPEDSGEAFPPGSILVVPLRIASGVRMKILESWARAVPVLATPEAAAGLEAQDGRELLLFRDAEELVPCLRRLRDEPALASRLTENGRKRLQEKHSPAEVAAGLIRVYEAVLARQGQDPVLI